MPCEDVDRYLAALDEPKRSTLARLRETITSIVPDAEEGLAYGSPAYKLRGKAVAGFAAFKTHLTYLPHSGSVLTTIAADVSGYKTSKGALQFDVDAPLPHDLVRTLIETRIREVVGAYSVAPSVDPRMDGSTAAPLGITGRDGRANPDEHDRSASVGAPLVRSDMPVPRLSKMIKRANDASPRRNRSTAGSSHSVSR